MNEVRKPVSDADSANGAGPRSERDLNKPGRRDSSELGESVRRTNAAGSDLVSGTARAIAEGFRAYGEQVTADNALKLGLSNGFLEGTVAGYARLYEELGATARRVLEDLRQPPRERAKDAAPQPIVVVDYERLAKMVAVELSRMQGAPVAPPVPPSHEAKK